MDNLLTAREIAAHLRVSQSNISEWARAGIIPFYGFGCLRRYRIAEVEEAESGNAQKLNPYKITDIYARGA